MLDEAERSGSKHTSPEARFAWGSAVIGAAKVLSTTKAVVNFMLVEWLRRGKLVLQRSRGGCPPGYLSKPSSGQAEHPFPTLHDTSESVYYS